MNPSILGSREFKYRPSRIGQWSPEVLERSQYAATPVVIAAKGLAELDVGCFARQQTVLFCTRPAEKREWKLDICDLANISFIESTARRAFPSIWGFGPAFFLSSSLLEKPTLSAQNHLSGQNRHKKRQKDRNRHLSAETDAKRRV